MLSDDACDITVSRINYLVERFTTAEWSISGYPYVGQWVAVACVDGMAQYKIDGIRYSVSRGDFVFLSAAMHREAASDPKAPWHFYSLGFDLVFGDPRSEAILGDIPKVSYMPQQQLLFHELITVWQEKRMGYLLGSKSIVGRILYELICDSKVRQSNPAHYAQINKIVRMMRDNLSEIYDLQMLARMAGMSESHFRTVFKSVTGMSARRYQNMIRIDKAKDLLKEGSANVTEAAGLTGFQNVYYFSELFKKMTGHSPSYYHKQGKQIKEE